MNAKFTISTMVFLDTPRLYQYMYFDMNNNGKHYFTGHFGSHYEFYPVWLLMKTN